MTTTKQSWLKRSLAVLLAVMMVMSMGVANVFAAGMDEVSIPDANLKAAINQQIAKQTGSQREDTAAITEDEMASLTELVAENAGISDLKGIQNASNLKKLDLSGNNLSGAGTFSYLSLITTLEELDLSDNQFAGKAYIYEIPGLKNYDLSGNMINSLSFADGCKLINLETMDLSDNYIYLNESTIGYSEMVNIGIDKFNLESQKNLASLKGAYIKDPDSTNFQTRNSEVVFADTKTNTIDAGNSLGGLITFALIGYAEDATTKVTVNDEKYTVVSVDKSGSLDEGNIAITLSGLPTGENNISLSVMHVGGQTQEYTLKVNVQSLPTGSDEDSAGIIDPALQRAICQKLTISDYSTHVVTKEEMRSLTGSLTVTNAANLEGLQYATNLASLDVSGTFTKIPELSTKLTYLKITSNECSEVPEQLGELQSLESLELALPSISSFPDLSKTALKSLLLKCFDENVQNGTKLTKIPNVPSTLEQLIVWRYESLTALPENLAICSNLKKIELMSCDALQDFSALSNLNDGQIELSISNQQNATILAGSSGNDGMVDSLNSLTIQNCPGIIFSDDVKGFRYLSKLTITDSGLTDVPEIFSDCPELLSLNLENNSFADIPEKITTLSGLQSLDISGNPIVSSDAELAGLTGLTSLDISNCQLVELPQKLNSLTALITLNASSNYIKAVGSEIEGLSNVTTFDLSSNYLLEVSSYFSSLKSLQTLSLQNNPYTTVPMDPFEGLNDLKTVYLGGGLKESLLDEQTSQTIASLKEQGAKVTTYGHTQISILKSLTVEGQGEIQGVMEPIKTNSTSPVNLSVVLPEGADSITFTPVTLYEDTTMMVNGDTAISGQPITVDDLKKGLNEITIYTQNDYKLVPMLPSSTSTYVLSVLVGDYAVEGFPEEGKYYEIPIVALKENESANSMTNDFIEKSVVVSYKDGQYRIDFTTIRQDYMPSLRYRNAEGSYVDADELSRDVGANTATWRMYTDTLEEDLYISPYVVPMGYSPVCRLQFDLTKIVDITDTMPTIDKAALNIAINAAVAITEKRNVYTDASWKNFMEKLEAAQTIAGNDIATQDAVNTAAKELETAMTVGGEGGLVIDESKLANKTALKTAINEAKALQQGNHTATACNALQEAIADAQTVYDTLEASQTEVDTAAKSLNTAVTLFQNSGEASELDKNNLEDGVYSVYGEMIKTNREEKSMSNDAINHYIKLTVEDGKYYLNMDFHGLAYLNKFGYLAELSYYDNGYTYGQYGTVEGTLIPATVLSTQKNPDGSDLYDEFNQAGGSYEGKLYPDQIKFPLVADALADEDGYVPLHVFVPVMEDISAGTGDQDVLLKLDWSTLTKTTEDDPAFEPEEPVEQSPAVDYTDAATGVKVNADKGVFDEGVQIVVSEITSGAAYDSAASSLSDVGKKFKLYDIKFLDADGNEVVPNGTVSISFPVAAGYDSANLAVYRLADGGKVLVKGAVEDGYYTIITKSAGIYTLVEKGSTITDAENTEQAGNGNTDIPRTGDSSNVAVYALLALAAAGMMGVTLVTRKRKAEEK